MNLDRDVKSMLDEGEEILYSCSDSKKVRLLESYKNILIMIAIIILLVLEYYFTEIDLIKILGYSIPITLSLLGIYLLFFLGKLWKIYGMNYEYYVTNKKIIKYRFGRKQNSKNIEIGKIQNLDISRNKIEQKFNSGTIKIKTDKGYRSFNLDKIEQNEVNNLYEKIKEVLEDSSST